MSIVKCWHELLEMWNMRCNYSGKSNDDIDRISYLPDELRLHILSFLRTKEAVQTCVLSKTWKSTWAFLPNLFFNMNEFLPIDPDHELSSEIIREHEIKFEQFVRGMLQNREASELNYFILLWLDRKDCASCNPEALRDCILSALEQKPRFLCVSLCMHKLPSNYEIFTCASLQDVLVRCKPGHIEIAPNSIHLPHLKILRLMHVTVNDDFLDKLFLGCPIIEELSLYGGILNVSKVSSHKLKTLDLLICGITKKVEICTPSLSNLCISVFSRHIGRISLKKMPFLTYASIDLSDYIYSDGFYVCWPQLITSLSNVTNLHLTLSATDVKGLLENGVAYWPIFKNLKSLSLRGWCLNSDFRIVALFLRSPNLRRLTLHQYNPHGIDAAEISSWEEPKSVIYQREQLDIVEIIKHGTCNEWIDHLVKNLHAHVKTIRETIII